MKAMIFAAGYGKRLLPITCNKPKALVNVYGKPMLHWVVEKLVYSGFDQLVVNIHHHAGMMIDAINNLPYEAKIIISNEADQLLDTGGGLLKAREWLDGEEPFLVHNVDIISDINLRDLYSYHLHHGGIATLATSKRKSARYFLWQDNKLAGWENNDTNEKILVRKTTGMPGKKAFSGIQIINPGIFKLIKDKGKFSINKVYLELAKEHDIYSFDHDPTYWFDLGTIDKISIAEKTIKSNRDMFVR